MDNNFAFLSEQQLKTLTDIINRRDPSLLDRLRASSKVSSADAEQLMLVLNDEFMNHLDDDWEPTDYGRMVNGILSKINAARLQDRPEAT